MVVVSICEIGFCCLLNHMTQLAWNNFYFSKNLVFLSNKVCQIVCIGSSSCHDSTGNSIRFHTWWPPMTSCWGLRVHKEWSWIGFQSIGTTWFNEEAFLHHCKSISSLQKDLPLHTSISSTQELVKIFISISIPNYQKLTYF